MTAKKAGSSAGYIDYANLGFGPSCAADDASFHHLPPTSASNRNLRIIKSLPRRPRRDAIQVLSANFIRVHSGAFAVLVPIYPRQSTFICGSGLVQIEVRYFFQG